MLQNLIAIFIGGGIGSILRWQISLRFNPLHYALPLGTLFANLTGAFIIGLALAIFSRFSDVSSAWRLFIITGICGGLTTFSTFSVEVVRFLQDGRFMWALLNIMANVLGSIIMTIIAFIIVNYLSAH